MRSDWVPGECDGSDPAAELDDPAAVALGWTAGGELLELSHGFVLGGSFEAELFAGFGLAVEGLRDRGGSTDFAEGDDLDLKLSAGAGDVQHVAGFDLARSLGRLPVPTDAPEFAGLRGERTGLEETRGPQPFVDADGGHAAILPRRRTIV